jgi:hypothetical protein
MMAFNGKANFIDSRNDIFDHRGVMADYLAILNNRDTLKLLDHYSVDHALIKANLPLAAVLAVAGWREVMREGTGDNAYVLLAKTR